MTQPRQRQRLTVKQAVLARMALGVVRNALEFKKAFRRARKALAFIARVRQTQWRRKHPGLSRISAHGWRGEGNRRPYYKPTCTKKWTLGRWKLREANRKQPPKRLFF